ncbi:MAG: fatty acid desaturase [Filomicrobium sp.]
MSSSQEAVRSRQAVVGVALAVCILGTWAAAHVFGVFFYQWGTHSFITAPILVALSCWLYVGLFIVAHDCMHGSLIPFAPKWNQRIGQFCLMLYAGFEFDALNRKHHLHHRYSGTEGDPDFDPRAPHAFSRWYWSFFTEYFGWKQFVFLSVVSAIYLFALGVSYSNLIVFWALPAILSSVQLFYFGTYLPHRPGRPPFTDSHRARSNEWNWLVSLMTCFHFGYHHEHHLHPGVPWWRLPNVRNQKAKAAAETP